MTNSSDKNFLINDEHEDTFDEEDDIEISEKDDPQFLYRLIEDYGLSSDDLYLISEYLDSEKVDIGSFCYEDLSHAPPAKPGA